MVQYDATEMNCGDLQTSGQYYLHCIHRRAHYICQLYKNRASTDVTPLYFTCLVVGGVSVNTCLDLFEVFWCVIPIIINLLNLS